MEKGTITFMVSLLLRYTETLRLDLHNLESKQKRRNKYRRDAFLNNQSDDSYFTLFYSLASMEILASTS